MNQTLEPSLSLFSAPASCHSFCSTLGPQPLALSTAWRRTRARHGPTPQLPNSHLLWLTPPGGYQQRDDNREGDFSNFGGGNRGMGGGGGGGGELGWQSWFAFRTNAVHRKPTPHWRTKSPHLEHGVRILNALSNLHNQPPQSTTIIPSRSPLFQAAAVVVRLSAVLPARCNIRFI